MAVTLTGSEQVAQQVDLTVWPDVLPERLDHHRAGICVPGQPERDVLVDSHPGAAVPDADPPVPGVQPVIVSEQDDKGHLARPRECGDLGEQPARQAPGPVAFPDAQVDDPERPHDSVTHPDNPELHAQLARNAPAAGHREIPEMRGQLEIAPAGIPGKTLLQQRLQLPAEICADLGLRDTDYRNGLAVRARLAHMLKSSAAPDELLCKPL
jgi:hypothetical protein